MRDLNVNKAKLLETLKVNREKHIKEYRKTIEGWREQALKEIGRLGKRLKKVDITNVETLQEDDFPNLWIDSQDRPQCHVRDYDRAIAMLKMSIDETISISASDFDRYVSDEWEWKKEFQMSNSKYGL